MIERLRPALTRFRAPLERIGLPAWFIAVDLLWIAKPDVLGIDARHYQLASTAWLQGSDPWKVTEAGVGFAAGPHTLLFYAPTSMLPLGFSVAAWTIAGLVAAVWLLRRLELPIWFIAFPPLAHAIWNGNSQTIVLALLVAGGTLTAVVAVALKLYAGVTLVFRPRVAIVTGLVLLATLPLLPWQMYLQDAPVIAQSLSLTWNGSAWRLPVLILPTLLALWILRDRGSEWLAIPAVWPATEFYFAAMALPALSPKARPGLPNRSLVTAALALPAPLIAPLVVLASAAWVVWRDRQGTGAWGRGISAPTSSTR
jgi:hypothetical protein